MESLVAEHTIAKYQAHAARRDRLSAGARPGSAARAGLPSEDDHAGQGRRPPAIAYEYYNPDVQATGTPTQLTVHEP